jgi:hypothetical protein
MAKSIDDKMKVAHRLYDFAGQQAWLRRRTCCSIR